MTTGNKIKIPNTASDTTKSGMLKPGLEKT